MMLAEDFRAVARDALKGQWSRAALVGLLASLMGASIFGSSVSFDSDRANDIKVILNSSYFQQYRGLFLAGGALLVVYLLVRLIIGGAATLGYARYNLDLADFRETDVTALFSQFHRMWPGFCLQFLRWLYTFLWFLLFIIPGIIASYRYSMAAYILAEHPEMTASEAITRSKEMMVGNKFRLFCLGFSFIGWALACLFPLLVASGIATTLSYRVAVGIIPVMLLGSLASYICMMFLTPYMEAANAAFYREVSGTGFGAPQAQETAYEQVP